MIKNLHHPNNQSGEVGYQNLSFALDMCYSIHGLGNRLRKTQVHCTWTSVQLHGSSIYSMHWMGSPRPHPSVRLWEKIPCRIVGN